MFASSISDKMRLYRSRRYFTLSFCSGGSVLAGFIISLREGLEGALIVGIVLAALKKTGRKEFSRYVWQGVTAAVVLSLAAAWLLNWLGMEFEGRVEEIFEGSTMLLAAVLLTWMIFWMRRQAGNQKTDLEQSVVQAASWENPTALTWLAFLSVAREGLELALFLSAANFATGNPESSLGAWLGLAISLLIGWLIYRSSLKLNLRQFFLFINVLLVLFAAGLVAHGVHEFNEAGIIPSIIEHVWNTNLFINESQPVGQILVSLFGYNANPSLTEVFFYLLYFIVVLFSLGKLNRGNTRRRLARSETLSREMKINRKP